MRKSDIHVLYALVALLAMASYSVYASEDCSKIKQSTKRLACYDAAPKKDAEVSSARRNETPSKWEQEPLTFVNIKLGTPITESVHERCPTKNRGSGNEFDKTQWEKQGKPWCYYKDNPEYKSSMVYGVNIPKLQNVAYVSEDSYGNVVRIRIEFYSAYYDVILGTLETKFGVAHQKKLDKVRLNSGGELPNRSAAWVGENLIISVESLVDRFMDYDVLVENGAVVVTSMGYMKEQQDIKRNAVKDAASKL